MNRQLGCRRERDWDGGDDSVDGGCSEERRHCGDNEEQEEMSGHGSFVQGRASERETCPVGRSLDSIGERGFGQG